jgi:hypothetical protein
MERRSAMALRAVQFLKVGGRVVYRLSDIEAYERAFIRTPTVSCDRPNALPASTS